MPFSFFGMQSHSAGVEQAEDAHMEESQADKFEVGFLALLGKDVSALILL